MHYYAVFKNHRGIIAEPVVINDLNEEIAFRATDQFIAYSKNKEPGSRSTDWFLAYAPSKDVAIKMAEDTPLDKPILDTAPQYGGGRRFYSANSFAPPSP